MDISYPFLPSLYQPLRTTSSSNMIRVRQILLYCSIVLSAGCAENYEPPSITGNVDIIVVDGFLNSTDNSALVKLSRAVALSGGTPEPEVGAAIKIEDENGGSYSLSEGGLGSYSAQNLPLVATVKYRLKIHTQRDQEYLSDYIPLNDSPAIDSISWKLVRDGITFFVSTHDPENKIEYYSWDFVETWEYVSSFFSTYMMVNGAAIERPVDQQIYRCWTTSSSTQILVGSTTRLSNALISEFPLTAIEGNSLKLSQRYSILVNQKALTKEAFEFWTQLERTSESLGGLFDPLPSQVVGNIRSTSDSSEPVLGYFSGGTVSQKRIFVDFRNLPPEIRAAREPAPCNSANDIYVIDVADIPSQPNSTYLVDPIYVPFIGIVAYNSASQRCVDCRAQGGTTQRPDFW